jgi:hypothetical protein
MEKLSMKLRTGFVSNSSSSSFIVYRKCTDLTKEQKDEINKKRLHLYDEDSYPSIMGKHQDELVVLVSSIENGSEEDVAPIVEKLVENLGFNKDDFSIEIQD